jgi:FtsH-binding integral membrane protein
MIFNAVFVITAMIFTGVALVALRDDTAVSFLGRVTMVAIIIWLWDKAIVTIAGGAL